MRRLPPLPTVSDIIRLYGLSARSQLSQNFLLDLNVTDKLVRVAGNIKDRCVCEVGPGPGALTRSILSAGPRMVIGVEKDRRFVPSLEYLSDASGDRLQVKREDILEFDWEKECSDHVKITDWNSNERADFHIVGNLPFNISIPLLLQWLAAIPKRSGPFKFGRCSLTLTFQKEVAERILAPPHDFQRSRLSIMCQHLCEIKKGFQIRGSAFVPRPKVDVMVLKLTPLVEPVINVDYDTLEELVKGMFQSRRKIIRHGAKVLFDYDLALVDELFRVSGVNDTARAQELSLEEFGSLCNAYKALKDSAMIQETTSRTSHSGIDQFSSALNT